MGKQTQSGIPVSMETGVAGVTGVTGLAGVIGLAGDEPLPSLSNVLTLMLTVLTTTVVITVIGSSGAVVVVVVGGAVVFLAEGVVVVDVVEEMTLQEMVVPCLLKEANALMKVHPEAGSQLKEEQESGLSSQQRMQQVFK